MFCVFLNIFFERINREIVSVIYFLKRMDGRQIPLMFYQSKLLCLKPGFFLSENIWNHKNSISFHAQSLLPIRQKLERRKSKKKNENKGYITFILFIFFWKGIGWYSSIHTRMMTRTEDSFCIDTIHVSKKTLCFGLWKTFLSCCDCKCSPDFFFFFHYPKVSDGFDHTNGVWMLMFRFPKVVAPS